MLFHDGPAHASCFYNRILVATSADLLHTGCEEAGVESLVTIFGDRRACKERGELSIGEVCPGDRNGLILYIGHIDAQVIAYPEMLSEPIIDPRIVATPDAIQHMDDILQAVHIFDTADICFNELQQLRRCMSHIKHHHIDWVTITCEPACGELVLQTRQQIVVVHLPGER